MNVNGRGHGLTRRRVLWMTLAAVVMGAAVCSSPGVAARGLEFPRSSLTIETATGTHPFTVELADTSARRVQGLQYRQTLAADAGMLFDYEETRPVAMWMKNTYLPLDMLFIDAQGRVTRVTENTVPLSLTPLPSGGSVRAVLELNAGTARRLGIRAGARVSHPIFGAPAQ